MTPYLPTSFWITWAIVAVGVTATVAYVAIAERKDAKRRADNAEMLRAIGRLESLANHPSGRK
jgi:hypothetical protein